MPLGDLPGGEYLSEAFSVSADGNTVVGISRTAQGFEAFRWTQPTGMVGMGGLSTIIQSSSAQSISPDGSVIVGYAWATLGYEAFRWTAADGMVSLGELSGGATFGVANAVSADGYVVAGQSSSTLSGNGGEAFRWESEFPMSGLGDLPGGVFQSVILASSADGNVLVGQGTTETGNEAIVWDPINGMRTLSNAMQIAISGSDTGMLDGWTLTCATGISADGKIICGYGTNPQGITEGFVAKLPRFCYANCDGSNTPPTLNAGDVQCFLNAFASHQAYANCDGSRVHPVLNVNDFACFIQRYAIGCW
jgi:probable HAF family extracellular repeat protein